MFAVQFEVMQTGYLVVSYKSKCRHTESCSFESNCSQVPNEEMRYGGSYNNVIISGTPSKMVSGTTRHHRVSMNPYPAYVIRSSHEAAADCPYQRVV